uniref:Si:ch211-186j3.6 n=1 Tax=Erpetoichthys calabaricus TaxID=27687 RepID=A0A8C4RX14_ERPCA
LQIRLDKDADQGALRYSLHGQGAETEFIIDEVTGKIYAQKTLDREERAVWRFVILATDEGGEGLTGFTDVIINVWDINDNAPVFMCMPDNCNGNVLENSPADTSVMEMTATDLDDTTVGQNALLTYKIAGNAKNGINFDLFSINPSTGTIYVALGTLDREKMDKYFLVVEAKDGGGMTGTGTATIWVSDVNDHAPKFTQHSCNTRISENSEINSAVLDVSATDADTGENAQLTFSIISGDPEQKFYIESYRKEQRGILKLKKSLDYEKSNEHWFNLTIKVEDLDFSNVIHCVIEVDDYNDHAPVFIPQFYQLSPLPENIQIGTSITKITATDTDSGHNGQISYSILADSDPYGQFVVDQAGHVIVSNSLDRETVAQHYIIVLATDQGEPPQTGSATVQLSLIDVNDNAPEFESAYMPVVWENVPGPQIVKMNQTSQLLHAIDRDVNLNGPPFSFPYLLTFQIQKEFYLPIIMKDSGNPPLTTTNTLTITIGDENDHPHQPGFKEIYINSHRVLLLGIFLWTRWKSYKGLKEGVYHVSAHHDGWEDIRENVLNYDEEGGGEQDQVRAYPVQEYPAPSQEKAPLRRDVPPSKNQLQGIFNPSRKSLSFSSQDLARYLCDIIRDTDQRQEVPPFDSLQVYSTEGGGSLAGSLSSFSSAGLEEDKSYDYLEEWGPRFEKLKALYERAEASDI